MTFLEALTWMSESEENVATVSDGSKFKIMNGQLYVLISIKREWEPSHQTFEYLNSLLFSKPEPAPKEVEVVAYLAYSGVLTFAKLGSEQDMALSKSNIWRKVKVRFT